MAEGPSAAAAPLGARRRASRQMNREMPPIRITAPSATAIVAPVPKLLLPAVEVVAVPGVTGVVTAGLVLGVVAGACGTPGVKGLVPGLGLIGACDADPLAAAATPAPSSARDSQAAVSSAAVRAHQDDAAALID